VVEIPDAGSRPEKKKDGSRAVSTITGEKTVEGHTTQEEEPALEYNKQNNSQRPEKETAEGRESTQTLGDGSSKETGKNHKTAHMRREGVG